MNRRQARQILDGVTGVIIQAAESVAPIEVPLAFANPYGFMGAYLVADFDGLALAVLTAMHCGLIDREKGYELLNGGSRAIRRTFNLTLSWRRTGITRQEVREESGVALELEERFGKLPPEVLEGTRRGKHAPNIRRADPSLTAASG
jgi:integrating conjugative element protein (TIGR03761 family)